MGAKANLPQSTSRFCAAVMLGFAFIVGTNAASTLTTTEGTSAKPAAVIPWSQIGATAGADYKGDGLSVARTESGARLRCVFQRLEADAGTEGLWLSSTVTNAVEERFRVVACSIRRGTNSTDALPPTGTVEVSEKLVRFKRPGLVEEYSVSVDGVRQDFVVMQRPVGTSELQVQLSVTGAKVEQTPSDVQLVLEKSGRKIAYSRLRVTDATRKELPARMDVQKDSGILTPHSVIDLRAVVNDADAVYPVRIDPTFSDANWVNMRATVNGANWGVFAAVADGSGNLYIGGRFNTVGDIAADYIAKWNGSSWSALGSGMGGFNPWVRALAMSGTDLYAGGAFSTAGGNRASRIAKWDGTNWSAVGAGPFIGMDIDVHALAVMGGELYAGGRFLVAGDTAANRVAKWNGSSWSALGSGLNGEVDALAVSGSNLYVGGYFTTAGESEANYIARWNGSSWSALGSGMDANVRALTASGSDLYAGGNFTTAGGIEAKYIAKWNGTDWSALGSGMNSYVIALTVSGADLYAGGYFTSAGGNPATNIAKWNGSSWSALDSGVFGLGVGNSDLWDNSSVWALAMVGTELYAGGYFTNAGGISANYIAKWNGNWSALHALGSGINGSVNALAAVGGDVYAAGTFGRASGIPAIRVAKWNGSSWSALGSGLSGGDVYSLAVSGIDLYAGGAFTNAGGITANRIAKWNGSSWSALGSGMTSMNSIVHALAVSGSDLYAGGSFTSAGGSPANRIAKWNGSGWSALGSGMTGSVFNVAVAALAVSGSDLYAGGAFTNAGGITANRIAKWNGSSWSTLGLGMNSTVRALALSGRDLYAGGSFTSAGGSPANRIAKWNGSSWSALGSGMTPFGDVYALAMSGSDLYAAGAFTNAGGSTANYIARWNGSSWSALGSGMDANVFALTVSASELFVGGNFAMAGGDFSAYVARAYFELPTISILRSGADVTLSWPTFYESALLQQNAEVGNSNTWSNANYPITTNDTIKSATVPLTSSNQFFRLKEN